MEWPNTSQEIVYQLINQKVLEMVLATVIPWMRTEKKTRKFYGKMIMYQLLLIPLLAALVFSVLRDHKEILEIEIIAIGDAE